MSSILAAKNLDGRGIQVIVACDRGKGDVELYSSLEENLGASNGLQALSAPDAAVGVLYSKNRRTTIKGCLPSWERAKDRTRRSLDCTNTECKLSL